MIFLFLSECQCCDFHLRQMRWFSHVALPNLCRQQEIHASQWLYGTIYRFALHNLWWMRTCQMRRMLILLKIPVNQIKNVHFFNNFNSCSMVMVSERTGGYFFWMFWYQFQPPRPKIDFTVAIFDKFLDF